MKFPPADVMGSQTFELKLEDTENDLLQKMLRNQEFSDVTLISEDGSNIQAHRVVLGACSDFFKDIFQKNSNPKIIIYVDNANHSILDALVRFMYTGQVTIQKQQFKKFLEIGEKFRIGGLVNEENYKKDENNKNADIDKICDSLEKKKMDNIETIDIKMEETPTSSVRKEIMKNENIINIEQAKDLEDETIQDENPEVETRLDENPEGETILDETNGEVNINFKLSEDDDYIAFLEKRKRNRAQYMKTEKRFNCDKCEYSCKFKASLKIHTEGVHESVTHPCDKCENRFTQKSALYTHIRRVHEGIRYACDICGHNSSEKYKLKLHKANKHEGIRYSCDICSHSFSQKDKLKLHRSNKHA